MSKKMKQTESGFALIESLVAMVVVALGILGILGVQLRTLADTQTSVRRAQAIRLIEDLSERTKVNPNALGNAADYVIGAGKIGAEPVESGCASTSCTAKEIAKEGVWQWKRDVLALLPSADAQVFQVSDETVANNRRQLGVLISWRENERADGDAAANTAYRLPFQTLGIKNSNGNEITCAAGKICHLQYIQLNARCSPYLLGGADALTVFCAR